MNNNDQYYESYTVKRNRRDNADLNDDLFYSEELVKKAWIYPLTTLSGAKITNGLNISSEKITLMCTTPDKGKPITIYLSEDMDYDLIEVMDPNSPTQKILKNNESISFKTKGLPNLRFDELYMLTFFELNEDTNLEEEKYYLSKTIVPTMDENAECVFEAKEEFVNSYKTIGVKVFVTEPITNKIKQINVTSPVGALIGNIKVINEDGRFPDLYPMEGTEVYPKLMFPFQVQPTLNLINYWASDQIIPLKDIFSFLDSKGIKYNQEFSLNDFLKLGGSTELTTVRFDNVSKITYRAIGRKEIYVEKEGVIWVDMNDVRTLEPVKGEPYDTYYYKTTNAGGYPTEEMGVLFWYLDSISDVNVYDSSAQLKTTAYDTLLTMITESFWKDYEFEGATKLNEDTGELEIKDGKIYKLMEKYAQQDRYAVTTNNWLAWKRVNNSQYVLKNSNIVKRIEAAMAMLSGAFKSNFCINKGDNDDYKILLPYYFELQNSIDNPAAYVEYKDLKVKLKSNYFNFTSNNFTPIIESISNNKIYKLDINHYVFPEMTKNTETASIPSSMPVDQQLANGEYSKYQVKQFNKNSEAISIIKNDYGSSNINYNPLNLNYVANDGEFSFQDSQKVKEITISSFFGSGAWRITLVDENANYINLDMSLYDKYNTLNNFVNLIL